ncbi:MAG: SDR family NAD(P)-dependent oxidoreductase [Victivallales bacterium]|nr:SDR family NAD(P)-dependent oxidoreductase [Victivallales bacterium]
MQADLNDKVALVTGGGQNIGKAIGDVFAVNGAKTIYADIDPATAIRAATGHPGCMGVKMDVTDTAEVETRISEIMEQYGRIDILVNNAGVNSNKYRVTIDQYPHQEWKRLLGVDLDGLFTVSKAVAAQMKQQGEGRIINISSSLGLVAARLQCAFIAAKTAVIGLTKGMALELAPDGILVNGIAPGSILTDGTRALFYGNDAKFKDNFNRMLGSIPLKHPGECDDIAYAALFLAAPESRYITGHILAVDGGWTAGYIRDF